jgi:hypothetical protein
MIYKPETDRAAIRSETSTSTRIALDEGSRGRRTGWMKKLKRREKNKRKRERELEGERADG